MTGDDEIDQIVIAHEAIVAAARKSDLPTAWMRIADVVPQPDFIFIFDGASGMLNTLASKFGLKGMPPFDKASKSVPVDVYDRVHFACVLSKMPLYQPTLVILAPVCYVWSKVTGFASKSPSQMNALIKERATQTKLMDDIG